MLLIRSTWFYLVFSNGKVRQVRPNKGISVRVYNWFTEYVFIFKRTRFDLIDNFKYTSRYLDDIFSIENPAFAEHIPDIYPRGMQLNKANTLDKETSFLDLNIKVIVNNIHTSVYDKRDYFGFPIVNVPWLPDDVLRLRSYGINISHLVPFAWCCTSVFDFNCWHPEINLTHYCLGIPILQAAGNIWKVL